MVTRKLVWYGVVIWLVFLCLLREWGFTEKWSRRWRLWGTSYDSDTESDDDDDDGSTGNTGRKSFKQCVVVWRAKLGQLSRPTRPGPYPGPTKPKVYPPTTKPPYLGFWGLLSGPMSHGEPACFFWIWLFCYTTSAVSLWVYVFCGTDTEGGLRVVGRRLRGWLKPHKLRLRWAWGVGWGYCFKLCRTVAALWKYCILEWIPVYLLVLGSLAAWSLPAGVGLLVLLGLIRWVVWRWYRGRYPTAGSVQWVERLNRARVWLYELYFQEFYPLLWVFFSGVVAGSLAVVGTFFGWPLAVVWGLTGYYMVVSFVHAVLAGYLGYRG